MIMRGADTTISTVRQESGEVIFVDADNTLWDTDRVFASAQLTFLDAVERAIGTSGPQDNRLEYIRALDQALAERHHAGLRYPPRLLAKTLAMTLSGTAVETALRKAWSGGGPEPTPLAEPQAIQLERDFVVALGEVPALRPGVREGLSELARAGRRVFVLTEGSRTKVTRIASHYQLQDHFDRVLEAPKSARLFERVMKLTHPRTAVMVGDQLERDIRPAKAAGLVTIYFPGGFRPRWEPNATEVEPDFTISRFDEVPPIITNLMLRDR
jgi:putative hydrolase of the HAD superfamily